MRVNRYLPHVLVLPEDDADRQLANGFVLEPSLSARNIQVLPEAGGWIEVLERFKSEHIQAMNAYEYRYMVLLIDFDGDPDRLGQARAAVPGHLIDRVFILGALTEPEKLKADIGEPYEAIGLALARDCREGTDATWGHSLLRHNAIEVERLRQRVRPILFA